MREKVLRDGRSDGRDWAGFGNVEPGPFGALARPGHEPESRDVRNARGQIQVSKSIIRGQTCMARLGNFR